LIIFNQKMAPNYSKHKDASQASDRFIQHMASDPPPIKFIRSERAAKTPDDSMYHEFEFHIDKNDKKSTKMSKKMLMFENGDAEMWCDWRIEFDDLVQLAPLKTTDQKTNAVLTLFKGKALQHFKEFSRSIEQVNRERIDSGKTAWSEERKFSEILDKVAKEFFPVKHAYRRQCFYLRYHLYISGKFGVREFMARLHRINACIPYFPRKNGVNGRVVCTRLPDDELCDILNLAKKPEWTIKMLEANQDPYDYDLHGLTEYLERLETATAIQAKNASTTKKDDNNNSNSKRKRNNGNGNGKSSTNDNNQPYKKQKRTRCAICNKYHKGECYFKNKKEPPSDKPSNKTGNKFTVKEYAHLMQAMMSNVETRGPSKKTKRNIKFNTSQDTSDDEEQNFNVTALESSDEEIERPKMCNILKGMTLQSKKKKD